MAITREDLEAGKVNLSSVIDSDGGPADPIHPGEHLGDALGARKINVHDLADALDVPYEHILAILGRKHPITADFAVRLAKALGTSAELWMGLQAQYDLETAQMAGIGRDVRVLSPQI
jgi:addiction module HigA family antidote